MRRKIVKMNSILFALLPIISTNFSFTTSDSYKNFQYNHDIALDNENLKLSAVSGKIHIDNNWTAAKAAGICTGEGTYSDPYVIQNLEIDGGGSGSCIWIENSRVYFEIKNCRLFNAIYFSNAGGICLWNVSNGYVVDSQVSDNGYVGINLLGCNNNTILRNDACNQGIGLALQMSHNTLIKGNTFNNNTSDASLYLVLGSENNTILENTLNFNHHGIGFWYSSDNIVSGNFLKFNDIGLNSYEYSYRNTIYRNCFSNNSLAATDTQGTSHWDNGTAGNYWSDYTGVDSDENGIGDTPYNITSPYSGEVRNQDNYPLMECPLPVPVQDDNGDVLPIELIIIISVISGGAVIGVAALLLIRRKRKRIE